MTRTLATLLLLVPAAILPARAERGGAIPKGFSSYEVTDFAGVQLQGKTGEPVWGTLTLQGLNTLKFVSDEGEPKAETTLVLDTLTAIQYERVVTRKPRPTNPKWYNKPFGYVRRAEISHVVTLKNDTGATAFRVDSETHEGLLRLLEIKTGLRARKVGVRPPAYESLY